LGGIILVKVLAPGFYARQNIRTPVKVAIATLAVTQLLNAALVPLLGHAGLALSISLGACFNAGGLWWLSRRAGAWTPAPGWHQGTPTITWQIHELPTNGMENPGAVYPDGTLSWWGPWGVNDLGQLAGDGWNDDGSKEIAVVWNPIHGGQGWEVQQLPHHSIYGFVSDHYSTEAIAINDRGEIAGDASIDVDPGVNAAAIWRMSPRTHTWEMTELPALSGQRVGWNAAMGINENGDVVGWGTPVADQDWHNWTILATRWLTKDPSFVQAIGFPDGWSRAFGVNNAGIAVGVYRINGGPDQAFAAAIR